MKFTETLPRTTAILIGVCFALGSQSDGLQTLPTYADPLGNPASLRSGTGTANSVGLSWGDSLESISWWGSLRGDSWGLGILSRNEDPSELEKARLAFAIPGRFLQVGFSTDYRFGQKDSWRWGWGTDIRLPGGLQLAHYTDNLGVESDSVSHRLGLALHPLIRVPGWSDRWELGYEVLMKGWEANRAGERYYTRFGILPSVWFEGIWDEDDFTLGLALRLHPRGDMRAARHPNITSMEIRSHSRPRPGALTPDARTVHIDLNRPLVEGRSPISFLRQREAWGHLDVIEMLDRLAVAPRPDRIVLHLGRMSCGWGIAEELRVKLAAIRATGVRVEAYLESITSVNYYVATVADQIAMQPAGHFDLLGFRYEVTFYRGLLEKLGVEPQFVRHGEFKSFPEVYTRDSMSVEWEQDAGGLLHSLWDNYLRTISESRDIDKDSLQAFFNRADISLELAKQYRLIDTLLYEDELKEGENAGPGPTRNAGPEATYRQSVEPPARVAYITITGQIHLGKSRTARIFDQALAGSETVTAQLRRARRDKSIKGVVLRVDSPGGSAQASDIIWREVELLREEGKPVVASVGDMAASGGYYVICNADRIVTPANAILGSIGVLAGKFTFRGLYEKLGLGHDRVMTAEHADAHSVYRPWDPEELLALESHMDAFYWRFIEKVAEGRDMSKEMADSLGRGKVYSGSHAVHAGLADDIGGLQVALAAMRSLLKIHPARAMQLVELSPRDSDALPLEMLVSATSPWEEWKQELGEDIRARYGRPGEINLWALSPEALNLKR